jgi:beta-N-acetylhexosaminidase
VNTARAGLEQIELAPFRALLPEAPTAMTAHVVYAGLDAGVPASKSAAICTTLLRQELGFTGVLFSDDLEMKALSAHDSVEHNAVACIAAGCDALLICEDFELQQRAHAALLREVERSAAFRQRCEQAAGRVTQLRSGLTSKLVTAAELPRLWQHPLLQSLQAELAPLTS